MTQTTDLSQTVYNNRARKQHKSGVGSPRGNVGTEQKTEKRYTRSRHTRVPTINFAGHDCSSNKHGWPYNKIDF